MTTKHSHAEEPESTHGKKHPHAEEHTPVVGRDLKADKADHEDKPEHKAKADHKEEITLEGAATSTTGEYSQLAGQAVSCQKTQDAAVANIQTTAQAIVDAKGQPERISALALRLKAVNDALFVQSQAVVAATKALTEAEAALKKTLAP